MQQTVLVKQVVTLTESVNGIDPFASMSLGTARLLANALNYVVRQASAWSVENDEPNDPWRVRITAYGVEATLRVAAETKQEV